MLMSKLAKVYKNKFLTMRQVLFIFHLSTDVGFKVNLLLMHVLTAPMFDEEEEPLITAVENS